MADNMDVDESSLIVFDQPEPSTVHVTDSIARERVALTFDSTVEPRSGDQSVFLHPIDRAISIETDSLSINTGVASFIRNPDGQLLGDLTSQGTKTFDGDQNYLVEIGARLKLYLVFGGPFEIQMSPEVTTISFTRQTNVQIGARSKHQRPAHTVETTTNPADIMAAVSTFGTAMKTTSPERSFPTLRGHPPLLEYGDTLDIPDAIANSSSDISIEVPLELPYILTVAPLSYYLGATVSAGSTPRITSDAGWSYPLAEQDKFAKSVAQVLKQIFLLDCVTRTTGIYPVTLEEAEMVKDRISLDIATLYEVSHAERVGAFLEFDYDSIADLLPLWPAHATVKAQESSVRCLPHLVYELSTISTVSENPVKSGSGQYAIQECFKPVVDQIWVGDGFVPNHTKAIEAGYEHRLNLEPTDGSIRTAVVLNEPEFDTEGVDVAQRYGSDTAVDLEVELHEDLNTEELTNLIQEDIEFLHYIGHVTEEGIQCNDGFVDVSSIPSVGVTYFLLNACNSATQGIELIEAGGIGGIVTLGEVIDSSAAWFGVNIAKLLDTGYPLRAALKILEPLSLISSNYQVVGSASEGISSHESVPILAEVENSGEQVTLKNTAFHSYQFGVGSMGLLLAPDDEEYFLIPNTYNRTIERDEALEFFKSGTFPVLFGDELVWSYEIDSLPITD